MKNTVLTFILCMVAGGLWAQSSRVQTLQKGRNLAITTTNNQKHYYLVSDNHSHYMYRKDGQVMIDRDTIDVKNIRRMRFVPQTRFSLDEDSTAFGNNYTIDHGLLAFRRSMNTDKWNTLAVPFSLTGDQITDAFGEGTKVAVFSSISEEEEVVIELKTIALKPSETVIQAGVPYLIRPTKAPDIAEDESTSVVYGRERIEGPVYVIPGVTVVADQQPFGSQIVRSESDDTRFRFRHTFVRQNINLTNRSQYMLNDKGFFEQMAQSTTTKAFRGWMEESRNNNEWPVRFYIDGVEEISGIEGLTDYGREATGHDQYYDLLGRPVPSSSLHRPTPSLYIRHGKKQLSR